MEAKCYRGSCRQIVLSGHENSEAIYFEFSVLNVSQLRYFLGSVYRITIWRSDERILIRRKLPGISFIWTWKFGCYWTTNFCLQQQSDGTITGICFSQHKLDTRWNQNARGSCRQLVVSEHENLVAIGLQISVFRNSQMRELLGSVFRSTKLTSNGSEML